MDIIFNPPTNSENRYIRLIVKELKRNGYQVHALDSLFSSFTHFNTIKLVHLNWFENVDDHDFFSALISFCRKMAVLVAVRLSRKPLVWTMHNRTAHEKGMTFFNRALVYLLLRWSNRIVIHTHQSEKILAAIADKFVQKAVYIPHPHFIGVYGKIMPDPTPASGIQLLFMGMIKPYKNLELLIEVTQAFGDHVQLTIAGRAVDSCYQLQLEKQAAAAGNVQLFPYFIHDQEIAGLIASADILVLPYDLASSLNSGTVLLAFSYERTVICPEIGTIADLGMLQSEVFHYRYHDVAAHREALTNQITRALLLKQNDPARLREMGKRLYEHVAARHDQHFVGAELDGVYRALLSTAKIK